MLGLSLVFIRDEGAPSMPWKEAGAVAVVSPHGSFPVTQVGFAMALLRLDPSLCTMRLRNMGASVLFFVPGLREFLLLMGVRDASRRVCSRLLGEGYTVAICPGGNHEMASTSHTHEAIYYQRRLGFVRLAMAAGKPLLPCYAFGENQLFITSSVLLKARQWVARKLRVGIPIMFGRGWLLYGPPLPTATTFVMGRLVEVGPPNQSPSDAEVDAVFQRYLDEISRLWASNAFKYLPAAVAANGLRLELIGVGPLRHTVDAKP